MFLNINNFIIGQFLQPSRQADVLSKSTRALMRAELEQLVRIEGSPATIADMNTMLDWLALPDPRLLFKIVTKIFGEVSLLQNLLVDLSHF